jgi:DNA replication protein DnaD
MIEIVKADPGFLDALEYYHTQEEIEQIKRRENFDTMSKSIKYANDAIEKLTGEDINHLTSQELNAARAQLRIDQFTGIFIQTPETIVAANKKSIGRGPRGDITQANSTPLPRLSRL